MWKNKEELNLETLDFIQDIYKGKSIVYRTGIASLDEKLILQNGTINFIGGRSGQGKTRLVLRILLNLLKNNYRVAYITAEDNDVNLNIKMLELEVGFDLPAIYNLSYSFDHWKRKVIEATRDCSRWRDNFTFMNVGSIYLKRVVEILREAVFVNKADIVIYDYLQTIRIDDKYVGIYALHSRIAECFRQFALKSNSCIIGVLQLNRDAESVITDKPPTLSNLKGSGDYEQVAHSVILVKRHLKKEDNLLTPTTDIEIHIAKNRIMGWLGRIMVDKNYVELPKEI